MSTQAQEAPRKSQSKKERKVTLVVDKKPEIDIYNDPLFNEDGTRNMNIPFSLYATRKVQEEREQKKKIISVSRVTAKDKEIFQEALNKLKCQRQSKSATQIEYLKNLVMVRETERSQSRSSRVRTVDRSIPPCRLTCSLVAKIPEYSKTKEEKPLTEEEKRAALRLKLHPIIKIPPFCTKKWVPPASPAEARLGGVKLKPKPVIVIPPFKTCKWVPRQKKKPRKIVKIEYPPLTMRSTPWKPKPHRVKKLMPRVRLDKVFYPMAVSTLGKTWHNFKCLSKFQILRGKTSHYSKKFNFATNGKQSTFIAAVALAFAQFHSMTQWKSQHLDEIILYGDINCRRQIRRFRHQSVIKPCEIDSKIYLRRAKILIEMCETIDKGIFEPSDLNEMKSKIEEILKTYKALLICYCGQCYALWSDESAFYVLNSENTNENGKLIERSRGGCCAIRSTSLPTIVEYLASNFRVTKQRYEIYSFRIDKLIKIEEELEKVHPSKEKPLKAPLLPVKEEPIEVEPVQSVAVIPQEKPKTGLAAILFRHQPEPIFGDSFQRSSVASHGFLTCVNYLTRSEAIRAPFISSVAILMLRVVKSSVWMSSTMAKIFEIGHALFVENVVNYFRKIEQRKLELAEAMLPDPVAPKKPGDDDDEDEEGADEDDEEDEFSPASIRKARKLRLALANPKTEPKEKEEIPITELTHLVVELGRQKLEVTVENVVIGKIQSRKVEEMPLAVGLETFFRKFDQGIILGADVVAVWREQNYFFIFDPNHCHQYKRADMNASIGNSCLSWFKNLSDLVQHYINNLRKDQRGMVYKICKIDSQDFIEKANDWHNFKAIGNNKWIMSGKISETSQEFSVTNRGHQSTCMSCIALARTRQLGIVNWKSDIIDDVVRQGDEFYSGCILQLKEKDSLVDPNLALSDIGPEFQMENSIVDFAFDESVVYGKLLASDDSFVSLERGLEKYFEDDDMGVVIAAGISLAVFRFDGAFFLFDSHARDELGRNLKTLDPVSSCYISGAACLLRFTSLNDLASHMISNFEIGNATMYSINKVEVNFRSSATPCLYHYKAFGKEGNAAILRTYDEWHEDCERFKTEIDEKTLCNLFACLCFTKVINPHQWSQLDINEILKIGFKLLCTVANDLNALWKKLSHVEICTMRMKAEKKEGVRGFFVATDRLLPNIDRADEFLEEHIEISEIERRESERKSQTSQPLKEGNDEEVAETNEPGGDQSSIFPPLDSVTSTEKLPLLDILKTWSDQKEVLAILTSSLFNIAIFKMNQLYFIFDPKASNDIGMLVQKRFDDFIKRYLQHDYERLLERFAAENDTGRRMSKEEEFEELIFGRPVIFGALVVKPSQYVISMNTSDEDTVTINENGSSYCAWFTTMELLYEHILSKIPEKFRSESFVIHNFKISMAAMSELSRWNNFDAISQNHWILRASLSQNDTQFPVAHRNNQDVPNCVMSMMFARLCNSEDWNSTVLDVILKFGERLYKKSLAMQASIQPVHTDELKLSLNQLDLPVFIRPYIINVEYEHVKRDLIVKSNDETPLANLKETVMEFLTSSTDAGGLLIAKTYHVAIWKYDDAYMMFDPHDVGPDGIRKSPGFACMQRFLSHTDLVDTFWHNVKGLEGANEYQLVKISLNMDHYNEGVDEEFENKFGMECTPSITPILPRTIRAKTVLLQEECVEMTICYAIATLCVSQSLDPEYYTEDIIDRIILLGNELAHECRTNDEICFRDFDISKRSSCPDEINWNFQLNNTFANIQMDIFQRGVISKHPCPLPNLIFTLEEFFNFHSVGLLVTCDFITAMWKEGDIYFMFYACPINEQGRTIKQKGGFPGLVSFKSVFEIYNNILSNVRNEQGAFELRICTIALSDELIKKCEKKKTCKEIIMPAVSLQDPKYLESNAPSKLEKNQERQRMIEAIKKDGHNRFLKYYLGGFMCGTISKNSKTLDEFTRKYHAPSICAYCVAMTALKEPNCWTSEIIDAIIISGNSLYVESSVLSRKTEVSITNVVPSLCIGDCKVLIKVETCMEFAQPAAVKEEPFISIFEALFGCRKACYVMRKYDCWLLMKSGNLYFLFDPEGIEMPGKKKSHHRAILYRFDNILNAAKQLIECIKETSPVDENLSFEIGCVQASITERKGEKSKKVKKPTKPKPKCPTQADLVKMIKH